MSVANDIAIGDTVRILDCTSSDRVGQIGKILAVDTSHIPYQVEFPDGKVVWCARVEFVGRRCTCDLWTVLMVTGCKCGAMVREKAANNETPPRRPS